jgi:hypothetical protein
MICNVVVTKKDNGYTAKAMECPDIVVENDNREQVVETLKQRLIEYMTKNVEIVQVEIPDHHISRNPWLDKFGFFRDDPTFDDLQEDIRKVRIESDRIER